MQGLIFPIRLLFACLTLLCLSVEYGQAQEDRFYLRDGDRVVFYGDSITELRHYTTFIETYCVTRFPRRRFTFTNSGYSGDTAAGGAGGNIETRLRRDVLAYRPTVVTICLGTNDAGYVAYNPETLAGFLRSYRHLLTYLRQKQPGIRFTLLTPPVYDDVTRPPAFPGGYNGVLRRYGEALHRLAQEFDAVVAETNSPMEATLRRVRAINPNYARQLFPDRVHPSVPMHLALASAVLKAWKAPGLVSEIDLNAKQKRVLHAAGTTVGDLHFVNGRIRFQAKDRCLPWPIGRAGDGEDMAATREISTILPYLTIDEDQNRFRLKVRGLKPGQYDLRADGRSLGTFTAREFTSGINMAELSAHPANRRAASVLRLTRQHSEIHYKRWRTVQVPEGSAREIYPKEVVREIKELDRQEALIVKQERTTAQPRPVLIEIVPL